MDVLQQLATALAKSGVVAKASGSPDATYLYSEGGLFGSCKNDPVLINALVGPMGYESKLQFFGTKTENPIVESLTYIGSSGYAQSGACADCGKPEVRRCAQTACFGRVCQQTDEHQFDEIGLRANNNVQTLALYGNVTDPGGGVIIGQGKPVSDAWVLDLASAAYNLRRRFGQMWWNGNPANNLGGYAEFPGFDLLINTGHTDALTGVACDGLDSQILNYGNNVVGAAGSPSIVAYISSMVRQIEYRIMAAGFNPEAATIDIIFSPAIQDCVWDAFACEYGLTCASFTTANQRVMQNEALAVAQFRDEMRNNKFLRVDGKDYPVTLDNGITVTNRPQGNNSVRCSTIYVITRNLPGAPNGGVITYGEYQDMQATAGATMAWFNQQFGSTPVSITDGGRFAWAPTTYGGFCFDARLLSKPRIRMLMPQLAGRITNVCCDPLLNYPDVSGSGGVYQVDGGAGTTIPNYLYGDCWPTHVGE